MRYDSLVSLFLLISIFLISIFYSFISTWVYSSGLAAEEMARVEVNFRFLFISGVSGNIVTIKNIGNSAVYAKDITVYLNGERKECRFVKQRIEPKSAEVCVLDEICSGIIRVAGPSNADTTRCFL